MPLRYTWAQRNFHEVLGLFLEVDGSFPEVKASLRMVLGSRRGHRELRIAQPQQGRLSSFGSRLGIVAEETPRRGRGAASAGALPFVWVPSPMDISAGPHDLGVCRYGKTGAGQTLATGRNERSEAIGVRRPVSGARI